MLNLAIHVMNEYHVLLVKMQQGSSIVQVAMTNLEHLVDIQIMLGLSCLLPFLRSIHSLMKFAQKCNVFVCDYLVAMKVCQGELAIFYIDNETTFHHDVFYDFKALEACQHNVIPLSWVSNPLDLSIEGDKYLSFECISHNI